MTSKPSKNALFPILEDGDKTRNAILKVAQALNQADNIPTTLPSLPSHPVPSPRVSIPPDGNVVPPPRVSSQKPLSLQQKLRQRLRNNKPLLTSRRLKWKPADDVNLQTRYNLRSTVTPVLQHLPVINHIYDSNGKRMSLDALLRSPDATHKWTPALSNEWGRLALGNDAGVKYYDVIEFIFHHEIPADKKITYVGFVADHRPLKDEKWRIRAVVGGDKLDYHLDAGSPATDLTEAKIIFNSVISDAEKGARFCSMDIKDMFLCTLMETPEFMKVPYKFFPQDIRIRYNLEEKVHNGFIYIKCKKGMYGLKQAAVLAHKTLASLLMKADYRPILGSYGLWKHKSRPITFCLCVDDFGIKYWIQQDADHLCNAIGANFKYTIDKEDKHYCGLTCT